MNLLSVAPPGGKGSNYTVHLNFFKKGHWCVYSPDVFRLFFSVAVIVLIGSRSGWVAALGCKCGLTGRSEVGRSLTETSSSRQPVSPLSSPLVARSWFTKCEVERKQRRVERQRRRHKEIQKRPTACLHWFIFCCIVLCFCWFVYHRRSIETHAGSVILTSFCHFLVMWQLTDPQGSRSWSTLSDLLDINVPYCPKLLLSSHLTGRPLPQAKI